MSIKALLIGSIGVVAETSEYQRRAYNQALAENGVDWEWTPNIYKKLLQTNGGQKRLHLLSLATGQEMSEDLIKKIHARKTELACQRIVEDQVGPRPGVVEFIRSAKAAGAQVAWVTSTYEANTNAILEAAGDRLSKDDFDRIFHRTDVKQGKPAPDVYQKAMDHFGADVSECVAVEDSMTSLLAAKSAGLFTVVTLGNYHSEAVANIADLTRSDLGQLDWATLVDHFQKDKQPSQVV